MTIKRFFLPFMLVVSLMIFSACAGNDKPVSIEASNEIVSDEILCQEENSQSMMPSELDRHVLENFLSQFISLFSFGMKSSEDVYLNTFTEEELNTTPLVWYNPLPDYNFYNQSGSIISKAPFISDWGDITTNGYIATKFYLYDLDNSILPTIVIRWSLMAEAGISDMWSMYRFFDGEYRKAGMLRAHRGNFKFFHDDDGELIIFYNDFFHDGLANYTAIGYFYLKFTDANFEEIAIDVNPDWVNSEIDLFNTHVDNWLRHHYLSDFEQNPTMFSTGIPLVEILPLIDLQEELTVSIKQRLMSDITTHEPASEPLTEQILGDMNLNETIIDPRIHRDEAEVILRHFEAIENGDLSAFRDTLFSQDSSDMNHHLLLIADFFSDVIGVNKAVINNAIIIGDFETYNPYLIEDFPIIPRNTGLFVKRIDFTDNAYYFNLARVETINNRNEVDVYYLILSTNLMLNDMSGSTADEDDLFVGIVGHVPSEALFIKTNE